MSRVFGKTTDNSNDIVADEIDATLIITDEIITGDIQTTTEEATTITTDHLITTGPLGVDVTSAFGDVEMVMDPTTQYGLIRSRGAAFGVEVDTQGPGKFIKLATNGVVKVGIQDGRTTVYGDLYVTGTIYNIPTGYTFFTPVLFSVAGGLGVITYTTQTGVFSNDTGISMYSIEVAGAYAGSSSTELALQTFATSSSAGSVYGSNNMISTLQSPAGGSIGGSDNKDLLVNYSTGTFTPMSGSASFDIITSGMYLNGVGATTFTPTFTAGGSTFTYSTQTGYYHTLAGIIIYFVNIVGTYTGASGSTCVVGALPGSNGTGITSVSGSVQNSIGGSSIPQPAVLLQTNSSTGTLRNSATNTNIALSGAGSLNMTITGIIFPTSTTTLFYPSVIPQNGTWTNSATVNGYYAIQNSMLFFTIDYTGTVTSFSTDLRLGGFPLVIASNGVVADVIITGLTLPIALRSIAGSTTMTFYNSATQQKLATAITAQTVTMKITGYYIIQ